MWAVLHRTFRSPLRPRLRRRAGAPRPRRACASCPPPPLTPARALCSPAPPAAALASIFRSSTATPPQPPSTCSRGCSFSTRTIASLWTRCAAADPGSARAGPRGVGTVRGAARRGGYGVSAEGGKWAGGWERGSAEARPRASRPPAAPRRGAGALPGRARGAQLCPCGACACGWGRGGPFSLGGTGKVGLRWLDPRPRRELGRARACAPGPPAWEWASEGAASPGAPPRPLRSAGFPWGFVEASVLGSAQQSGRAGRLEGSRRPRSPPLTVLTRPDPFAGPCAPVSGVPA